MNDIQFLSPNTLKPYENNPRQNGDAVDSVAASIKEFGFKQPIVVDRDMVVIVGHTRLKAAKKLKLKKVPVLVADDLSEEQVNAYRLADNKTNELAEWDLDRLSEELDKILDIDMTDFGFELPEDDEEEIEYEDDRAPAMQHNVFENQDVMMFPINNYYGIPELMPTQTTGDKFLRFMDWKEIEDPENYIAHFYYDDYKFMSAWREPEKYLEKLSQFKAVVCPDFSSYTDFPIVLQILRAYRRNWCGAFWQYYGIDVIPDVQWGDTEESYNWCFEGIPKNATVALSSVGVAGKKEWNGKEGDWFKKGFDEMMNRLNPSTILWYGDLVDGCEGNIIHIPSYYAEKRDMLNQLARMKKEKGEENIN